MADIETNENSEDEWVFEFIEAAKEAALQPDPDETGTNIEKLSFVLKEIQMMLGMVRIYVLGTTRSYKYAYEIINTAVENADELDRENIIPTKEHIFETAVRIYLTLAKQYIDSYVESDDYISRCRAVMRLKDAEYWADRLNHLPNSQIGKVHQTVEGLITDFKNKMATL